MTEQLLSKGWGLFISIIEILLLYYFLGPLKTNDKIKIKRWQAYLIIFLTEIFMTYAGVNSYTKLLILTSMVFALCYLLGVFLGHFLF